MRRIDAPFLLLSVLLMFATRAATSAPRSIADCAAIKDAFSYNACLASFGPAQKGGGSSEGAGPAAATQAPAPAAPAPRATYRAHGRYHAEFTVGHGRTRNYARRRYRH